MGRHEPPTSRSYFLSVAASTTQVRDHRCPCGGRRPADQPGVPRGAGRRHRRGAGRRPRRLRIAFPVADRDHRAAIRDVPSPTVAGTRIAVFNGAGVSGLAGDTLTALVDEYGYVEAQEPVDDAPATVDVTTIYYRSADDKVEAEFLANDFFGELDDVRVAKLQAGSDVDRAVQVAIYLGNDYADPRRPDLEALRERAPPAGILLDFDGSLSEIVARPELAAPVDGAREVLAALVGALPPRRHRHRTALRGGGRAPERAAPSLLRAVRARVEDRDARARRGRRAAGAGRPPSVVPEAWVEDKGSSIAVHYRQAPDPVAARAALLVAAATGRDGRRTPPDRGQDGARARPARSAAERRSRRTARRRARAARRFCTPGTIIADLDAFAALDRLRATGGHDGEGRRPRRRDAGGARGRGRCRRRRSRRARRAPASARLRAGRGAKLRRRRARSRSSSCASPIAREGSRARAATGLGPAASARPSASRARSGARRTSRRGRTGSRRTAYRPSRPNAPALRDSTRTPCWRFINGPSIATRFIPSITGFTNRTS